MRNILLKIGWMDTLVFWKKCFEFAIRHLELWVGICADSYESAICGFWVGGIILNLNLI